MNDDLNTPRAVAALFGLMKAVQKLINKGTLTKPDAKLVADALDEFNSVLGIFYEIPTGYFGDDGEEGDDAGGHVAVPDSVMDLVRQRTEAKDAKGACGSVGSVGSAHAMGLRWPPWPTAPTATAAGVSIGIPLDNRNLTPSHRQPNQTGQQPIRCVTQLRQRDLR